MKGNNGHVFSTPDSKVDSYRCICKRMRDFRNHGDGAGEPRRLAAWIVGGLILSARKNKNIPYGNKYRGVFAGAGCRRLHSAHYRILQACIVCTMNVRLKVNRGCKYDSYVKEYNINNFVIRCNNPQQQVASSGTRTAAASSSTAAVAPSG